MSKPHSVESHTAAAGSSCVASKLGGLRPGLDLFPGRRLEAGSRRHAPMPLPKITVGTHEGLPFGKAREEVDLRRERQIGERDRFAPEIGLLAEKTR